MRLLAILFACIAIAGCEMVDENHPLRPEAIQLIGERDGFKIYRFMDPTSGGFRYFVVSPGSCHCVQMLPQPAAPPEPVQVELD